MVQDIFYVQLYVVVVFFDWQVVVWVFVYVLGEGYGGEVGDDGGYDRGKFYFVIFCSDGVKFLVLSIGIFGCLWLMLGGWG